MAESSLLLGDPRLIVFLNDLGVACKFAGHFEEADAAYERALVIADSAPAAYGDARATLLHNLGGLEHARGCPQIGEGHARRGLALRKAHAAVDAASVAADLSALASLVDAQHRHDEASALYREALHIWSTHSAVSQSDVAVALANLAAVEHRRGRSADAEATYRLALDLREQAIGRRHPDLAPTLNNLGLLLKETGRPSEAAALYRRALAVSARPLGFAHPTVLACRANLDELDEESKP
jgi:tetratricopeptide (TPR) repeat protein